MTVNTQPEGGT